MHRVLYLFEYPTLHGGERSLLAALPAIRAAGYHPLALAPSEGDLMRALGEQHVEVASWELFTRDGMKLPQEELRRRLAAALARLRPGLIHANSLSTSRLAGPVAAAMGAPSIGHVRDILTLTRRAIDDLNQHTRLLAVSVATRDWHVAQGLSAEKTFVCYNGVDLDRFRPRGPTGSLHAELRAPPETQFLGSIGQIGPRKGLDVTAEALHRLAPRYPSLHWVIVGERFSRKQEAVEYEQRLRAMAATFPLAGRVHFLGVRRDVERILGELTLLVHAARQEPLGRVLLEAAAAGLPTVATDVGGTAEILVRPEFAELLAPCGDATGLAAAIERLMNDAARREALARRLRRRAEEAFSVRDAAERLLGHYQAVTENRMG